MRTDIQNAILLVLCLILLFTVFSLSASAATSLFVLSTDGISPSYIFTNHVSSSSYVYSAYTGYSEAVYVGYVLTSPKRIVFLSSGPASVTISSPNEGTTTITLTGRSGDYYFVRYGFADDSSNTITPNPDIPTYSDLNAFVEDVSSTLYNSLTYSLPPGNIAFIQVPSAGASYTLKTRMPESVLGSNHYPGNNQVLTLVNSLPSGGSAPSSPLIPWQQDGALSVLGLSRNATYSGTNASAGYLCVVNPLYYSGTANGPYEFLSNGSIDITIDFQSGLWVYPLDSSLGFTSGLGINVDTEIINDPFTGTVDPDTGEITWIDSSGGSSAPVTGGGNLVSTSETIFDFLRNIADEISTFLKGPIQSIQTVVAAIRQFLSSFTQLYIWLPSPVYNLITSALMIALTIGVIKIFV